MILKAAVARKAERDLDMTSFAFPNAYLETDVPPRSWPWTRILSLVSLAGLSCFGLSVLFLHLAPTGYDPIRQAVSDYAVGPFGVFMAIGFFGGGVGVAALGVALLLAASPSRAFNVGTALVLVAGISLFLVGLFPTDLEGSATTFHGMVHSVLSQVVFSLGPIGMLLISFCYGKRWFGVSILIYAVTGAFLAANLALSLGQTGIAERFFILFLLCWWLTASIQAFRGRLPA